MKPLVYVPHGQRNRQFTRWLAAALAARSTPDAQAGLARTRAEFDRVINGIETLLPATRAAPVTRG